MREKMRAALDRSDPTCFDLKQGAGGIVDIEFMVQYAALRWASTHPELTAETSTIALLERLAGLDLLANGEATELAEILRRLRELAHRRALAGEAARIEADALRDERERVGAIWRRLLSC
jgi:glutamate-ammonia-ligase adenylyltransferase